MTVEFNCVDPSGAFSNPIRYAPEPGSVRTKAYLLMSNPGQIASLASAAKLKEYFNVSNAFFSASDIVCRGNIFTADKRHTNSIDAVLRIMLTPKVDEIMESAAVDQSALSPLTSLTMNRISYFLPDDFK